jgi:hypothetical protein
MPSVPPCVCVLPCALPSPSTVLINISIWDKHASPEGLAALLICLCAAAAYQQSPIRKNAATAARANELNQGQGNQSEASDSEAEPLSKEPASSKV